jgi:hypothetical protein
MCEVCVMLDEKIAHYRQLSTGLDRLTTDRIERLIVDLERQRDAMHPADGPPAEYSSSTL